MGLNVYRRKRILRTNAAVVVSLHLGGRPHNRLLGWSVYLSTEPWRPWEVW